MKNTTHWIWISGSTTNNYWFYQNHNNIWKHDSLNMDLWFNLQLLVLPDYNNIWNHDSLNMDLWFNYQQLLVLPDHNNIWKHDSLNMDLWFNLQLLVLPDHNTMENTTHSTWITGSTYNYWVYQIIITYENTTHWIWISGSTTNNYWYKPDNNNIWKHDSLNMDLWFNLQLLGLPDHNKHMKTRLIEYGSLVQPTTTGFTRS